MYQDVICFNYWEKKCIRKCWSYFAIFSGAEVKSDHFDKILTIMLDHAFILADLF